MEQCACATGRKAAGRGGGSETSLLNALVHHKLEIPRQQKSEMPLLNLLDLNIYLKGNVSKLAARFV